MAGIEIDESPWAFLFRVWNALLRIFALATIGAAHWGIEQGLSRILPDNFKPAKLLIEDVSFLFFLAIYLYLLWDMLKVFIPWLQAKPYPGTPLRRKK